MSDKTDGDTKGERMTDKVTRPLWRSVREENFERGTIIDGEPADEVLHPDFQPRTIVRQGKKGPTTTVRPADVKYTDAEQTKIKPEAGGTSLWDIPNYFTTSGWKTFEIPINTPIPATLVIRQTRYDEKKRANHYQIEARTTADVTGENGLATATYKGALDNLARAAVATAYMQAH